MWVLLEGPEGTGKTTKARNLEAAGWHYEHATELDTLPNLAKRMQALSDKPNVVWDRAHLSEMVYAPLRRGLTPDPGMFNAIEAFLLDRTTWAFLMEYVWEEPLRDNRQVAGGFAVAQSYSRLRWQDDKAAFLNAYGIFVKPDPEDLLTKWEPAPDNGIGTRAPKCWVVAVEAERPTAWPLTDYAGLSLVWPSIDPSLVRVTETDRGGGFLHLGETWERLGRPPTIALGMDAIRALRKAGVQVAQKLPHPRSIGKFHPTEAPTFRHLLQAGLELCTT